MHINIARCIISVKRNARICTILPHFGVKMSKKKRDEYSGGTVFGLIEKTGNALMLNILFLLCCLPVVTAGASLSAYYYAMTKCVRFERGYPAKEFFRAFKMFLLKGIGMTVLVLLAAVLLVFNLRYAFAAGTEQYFVFGIIYCILLLLLAMFVMFVFPVISRFGLGFGRICRITLYICVRYVLHTLALLALTAAAVFLMWKLSVGFILIVPAAACYASSFIIEPVFARCIPEGTDERDAFFFENEDGRKNNG